MALPGIKFVKFSAVLASLAFVLNLLWELLQMPLYATPINYPWCCIWATFGDVIITFIIYGTMSLLAKNIYWIYNLGPKDALMSIILGIVIAVVIEVLALSIGRWQYTSAMPIVPFVNVGLTPVLQMMLLPLLTFYLTKFILGRSAQDAN